MPTTKRVRLEDPAGRKRGPVRKKKEAKWLRTCGYRNGAPGSGVKKPALEDNVARAAMAALESSDSSDSEGEDSNPVDQTPMHVACMEWRETANKLKKELDTMEKELLTAKSRQRGAMRMMKHSEYLLGVAERSSNYQRESFMAEISRLKAENDDLKPICPICQDEEAVATWVAECGHRVCCDRCVELMHRCKNRCPLCREFMAVSILRRLQGAGTQS